MVANILQDGAHVWPWLLLGALSLCVGSFVNVLSLRLPPLLAHRWHVGCADALASHHLDTTTGDSALTNVQSDGRGDNTMGDTMAPSHAAHAPPDIVCSHSRCPHCRATLGALALIPIVGFICLRRRCAHCGVRIAWRYPAVELLTLALSLVVVWQLGWSVQAAAALLLAWGLLALALMDYDCMLLPDVLSVPMLWCGLVVNAVGVFASAPQAIYGAIGGYLCLYVPYRLHRHITGKEGLGYGDFKLAALLGAWLGVAAVPSLICIAALAAAAMGITLLALGRTKRNTPLPFGPWLALSGYLHLVLQRPLLGWWF